MVNGTQVAAISIVCCIVLIVAAFLFGFSWSVLQPLEMGLNLNSFSQTIDSVVYTSGRYCLGLGHSFVVYPRNLIDIDFSSEQSGIGGPALDAGTADGQSITLEVSVYCQLNQATLIQLYHLYSADYSDNLVRVAQSTLKNTAVLYNTTEYFTLRKEIAEKMALNVQQEFQQVFASVVLLQLRGIGLASGFETQLINNVVAAQQLTKAAFDKQLAIVNSQTTVITARAQGEITTILGQANADATRIQQKATSDGIRLLVDVDTSVYAQLESAFGFTKQQIAQFLFYTRNLDNVKSTDQLVVGFNSGANIIIGAPGSNAATAAST